MEATTAPPVEAPAENPSDPRGEEQPAPKIEIEGAGQQLSLAIGGRKPDTCQVKLRGGSIAVSQGEFKKGDVVDLLVKARCVEVAGVDKVDGQTGDVTETLRRHVFRIQHVEKV